MLRAWDVPTPGRSAIMEVEMVDMTDVTGRPIEAEGSSVSRVCDLAAGSYALRRRESDGKIGWGEDQAGRRVDHVREMVRARPARR
jgi:hypothetical protein